MATIQDYFLQALIVLTCELKIKDVREDFNHDKQMFDFNNYSNKSKYCGNSNKIVIGKIKVKAAGIAIHEFVGMKPKMYSFLEYNG